MLHDVTVTADLVSQPPYNPKWFLIIVIIIIIIIKIIVIIIISFPFTARVVGAPQMSSQPVSSHHPHHPKWLTGLKTPTN